MADAPEPQGFTFLLEDSPLPERSVQDRSEWERTRFSGSIGRNRARLDSNRDEDVRLAEGPLDETPHPSAPPPEDLPPTASVEWPSDTPTARELWKQARRGLAQKKQEVHQTQERGFARGKALARAFRESLAQGRVERAQARRGSSGTLESLPTTGPKTAAPPNPAATSASLPSNAIPKGRDVEELRPDHPATPFVTPPNSTPPASRSIPPTASRPIPANTNARTQRSPLARARGPLACAATALLVYVASTQSFAHFSPTDTGPKVPDLGSLPLAKSAAAPSNSTSTERRDRRTTGAPQPSGPVPPVIEKGPLPVGITYPGKGLIEVVTSERELVYVDGVFVGRGPLRRVPVLPGEHGITIRSGGAERDARASVDAAGLTRVVFPGDVGMPSEDTQDAEERAGRSE